MLDGIDEQVGSDLGIESIGRHDEASVLLFYPFAGMEELMESVVQTVEDIQGFDDVGCQIVQLGSEDDYQMNLQMLTTYYLGECRFPNERVILCINLLDVQQDEPLLVISNPSSSPLQPDHFGGLPHELRRSIYDDVSGALLHPLTWMLKRRAVDLDGQASPDVVQISINQACVEDGGYVELIAHLVDSAVGQSLT